MDEKSFDMCWRGEENEGGGELTLAARTSKPTGYLVLPSHAPCPSVVGSWDQK